MGPVFRRKTFEGDPKVLLGHPLMETAFFRVPQMNSYGIVVMEDSFYSRELERLAAEGNFRSLTPLEHTGCEVVAAGRKLLNLSSNDYLGLGADRNLRAEFLSSVNQEEFFMSSSSSRLLSGDFPVYEEVESMLAGMFGKEAALVFNSGYHMNLGILPAVAGKDTLIVADKLVHASIIDGIRLSGADFYRFRHNDLDRVENILRQSSGKYRQIIIVVESVYSMDGDRADLKRICSLKRMYGNVAVYVDEAHAFGVLGSHGLGLAEEQGCIGDIDWICGTFGKALGSVGGFTVCSRVMRDFLVNRMRPLIFSTALPPASMMWTRFLLNRMSGMAPLRKHLSEISEKLRDALKRSGYPLLSDTHIIPMLVGRSDKAVEIAGRFRENGFFVLPVRPPTVPEGSARLRFSLTANMSCDDIGTLIRFIGTSAL